MTSLAKFSLNICASGVALLAVAAGAPSATAQTVDQIEDAGQACFSYALGVEEADGGILPEEAGLTYLEDIVISSNPTFTGRRYANADRTIRLWVSSSRLDNGLMQHACGVSLPPGTYDQAARYLGRLIETEDLWVGGPLISPGIRDVDRTRRHMWTGDGLYINLGEDAPSPEWPQGGVAFSFHLEAP